MQFGFGVDIGDYKHFIVLVKFFRGNFAFVNLTENTIVHIFSPFIPSRKISVILSFTISPGFS